MKKVLLFALPILLFIGGLIYYVFRSTDDYLSALPTRTHAVVRLDLGELASESGVDVLDLLHSSQHLAWQQLGISFTDPVYAFVASSGYYGLLCKMQDEDDLVTFCQNKKITVQSQRGLQWAELDIWLLCFDDEKALLMGPTSPTDQGTLRNEMARLMKQEKQDNNPNRQLAHVAKSSGALCGMMDLTVLPKDVNTLFTSYLPKGFSLDEIHIFSSLQIKKEGISLVAELLSDNESVQARMQSLDTILQPIKGDLLNHKPSDPLFWFGTNLKGEKLLDLLRQIPSLRTKLLGLNMCIDVDLIIKSISGDVSCAVQSLGGSPQGVLTAQLSDTDFLDNVSDWKTGIAQDAGAHFRELGNQFFSLGYDGQEVFFGVRNRHLFVSPSADLATDACTNAERSTLAPLRDDIVKYRLYATLDMAQFTRLIAPWALMLGASPAVYESIDHLDRLHFKLRDAQHFEMELTSRQPMADIIISLLKS